MGFPVWAVDPNISSLMLTLVLKYRVTMVVTLLGWIGLNLIKMFITLLVCPAISSKLPHAQAESCRQWKMKIQVTQTQVCVHQCHPVDKIVNT